MKRLIYIIVALLLCSFTVEEEREASNACDTLFAQPYYELKKKSHNGSELYLYVDSANGARAFAPFKVPAYNLDLQAPVGRQIDLMMQTAIRFSTSTQDRLWICVVSEVDAHNTSIVVQSGQSLSNFTEFLNLLKGVVIYEYEHVDVPLLVFYVMPSFHIKNWEFLSPAGYDIAIFPRETPDSIILLTDGGDNMMRTVFTAFGNKAMVTDLRLNSRYIRLNTYTVENNIELPPHFLETLDK